jgi:hypothetical protein
VEKEHKVLCSSGPLLAGTARVSNFLKYLEKHEVGSTFLSHFGLRIKSVVAWRNLRDEGSRLSSLLCIWNVDSEFTIFGELG